MAEAVMMLSRELSNIRMNDVLKYNFNLFSVLEQLNRVANYGKAVWFKKISIMLSNACGDNWKLVVIPPAYQLELQGRVVTLDAMHTQKQTARYLVEDKHADYLFIVKEDQKTLLNNIKDLDMLSFLPSTPDN